MPGYVTSLLFEQITLLGQDFEVWKLSRSSFEFIENLDAALSNGEGNH